MKPTDKSGSYLAVPVTQTVLIINCSMSNWSEVDEQNYKINAKFSETFKCGRWYLIDKFADWICVFNFFYLLGGKTTSYNLHIFTDIDYFYLLSRYLCTHTST